MAASFPASIKSFGPAHQDFTENILAAHINDLQDEVSSIETNLGALVHQGTNLTGGTTTYASVKARIEDVMAGVRAHTHDGTSGVKLSQSNTHQSPDTDAAAGSLHHTLGTGANQAASGTHTHTQSQSHGSPDTDSAPTALHHTLGTGANQAAQGTHTHTADPTALTGVGVVVMCAAAAPAGYLLCDGTAVSRTTYAALWTYLGTTSSPWGQGNGTSTFNVPDFRSRMPIGAGTGTGLTNRALGTTGGAQDAVVPTHSHTGSTAGASSNHQHDVSHAHSASMGTESADHSHDTFIGDYATASGGSIRQGYVGPGGRQTGGRSAAHVHGVSVDTNYFSSGYQSSDHSHSTTINAAGVAVTDARMNPWAAINFAIKY